MKASRRLAGWLVVLAAFILVGCATPARTPAPPGTAVWSGRMALQVDNSSSQSFSGGFELKGSAHTGELTLFTPLGGTLAVLSWAPGSALLRSNGQTRQFDSVDALLTHATGAPIPVAALFDWLAGVNTSVPGWQADLSQLAQGRLRARRADPPPAADLRVAFER